MAHEGEAIVVFGEVRFEVREREAPGRASEVQHQPQRLDRHQARQRSQWFERDEAHDAE